MGFFFGFCICVDQETGFVGGICAGGMLDEDNDKSSGFGEGSVSLNKSLCDGCDGVDSSIVAFNATRSRKFRMLFFKSRMSDKKK